MNIRVMIDLGPGDTLGMDSVEAAEAILGAVGGDINKDICSVQLSQMGQAGNLPVPPVPTPTNG